MHLGCFLIYFIIVYKYEIRNKVSNIVTKNYSMISKHDNKNNNIDNHIVLLSTKHPKYNYMSEDVLSIGDNASVLQRDVFYCQYREYEETQTDENGNTHTTYRYSKSWVDRQINSLFFNSFLYRNPKRNDYPRFKNYSGFSVGDYTIDVSLIKGVSPDMPWDKNDQKSLQKFFTSTAHLYDHFEYIGNGIFFSPYNNKKYKDKKYMLKAVKYDTFCTPGDIYFKVKVFKPKDVTVLGYKKGMKILRNDINGTSYHNVSPGIRSLQYLLDSQASALRNSIIILRIVIFLLNAYHFDIYFLIIELSVTGVINLFSRAMNETISLSFNVSMSIIIIFVSIIISYFFMQFKMQRRNFVRYEVW